LDVTLHHWEHEAKKMNTFPSSPTATTATPNLAETARGAVESMRNTAQAWRSKVKKPCRRLARLRWNGGFGLEAGHHVRFRDYEDDAW
jgi:hypothetical protein